MDYKGDMLTDPHCILNERQSQGYRSFNVRMWGFQVIHLRCVEYKLQYNMKYI
jgi:hypothetical protein